MFTPFTSNTRYPGFSSAQFFAFSRTRKAPICDLASAQVLRTRYQMSAVPEAPPTVPQMFFKMVRIFSPYPAPAAQPFPWGFSCCPSHSTYSALPLVTYLKRGSTQSFCKASVEAYAFRCWIRSEERRVGEECRYRW